VVGTRKLVISELNIRKSGGSHVVFGHNESNFVVTVPAHKPIKPVYMSLLIKSLFAK